jgi:hypothetical protein
LRASGEGAPSGLDDAKNDEIDLLDDVMIHDTQHRPPELVRRSYAFERATSACRAASAMRRTTRSICWMTS